MERVLCGLRSAPWFDKEGAVVSKGAADLRAPRCPLVASKRERRNFTHVGEHLRIIACHARDILRHRQRCARLSCQAEQLYETYQATRVLIRYHQLK